MQTESSPLTTYESECRIAVGLHFGKTVRAGQDVDGSTSKPGDIVDRRLIHGDRPLMSAFSGPTVILMRCSQSGSISSPCR